MQLKFWPILGHHLIQTDVNQIWCQLITRGISGNTSSEWADKRTWACVVMVFTIKKMATYEGKGFGVTCSEIQQN